MLKFTLHSSFHHVPKETKTFQILTTASIAKIPNRGVLR